MTNWHLTKYGRVLFFTLSQRIKKGAIILKDTAKINSESLANIMLFKAICGVCVLFCFVLFCSLWLLDVLRTNEWYTQ